MTELVTELIDRWLNGRGKGARYDGTLLGSTFIGSCSGKTGSGSAFSNNYKVFMRKYFEAQTSAYEKGQGWILWSWKVSPFLFLSFSPLSRLHMLVLLFIVLYFVLFYLVREDFN